MSKWTDRGLKRFPTGIPSLDRILGGGVPLYATIIIAGRPGTGKTILSQQMLFANAERGRKGLYLTTLSESPIKSARYQSEFAFFDPAKFGESVVYVDIGETLRREGVLRTVDVVADLLRQTQPSVVVIDSFKVIHDLASSPKDVRTFVYDLAIELSAVQCTSFLVGEYDLPDIPVLPEFAVGDGIIWLALESGEAKAQRSLRVLKMRGVNHPATPFSFNIDASGIDLYAVPAVMPASKSAGQGEQLVRTGIPGLDELLRGGTPVGSPLLVSGEAGVGKSTLCTQFIYNGAKLFDETGLYFSFEEPPERIMANARAFGWDLAPLIERGKVRFYHTPLPLVNADRELMRIQAALAETGARRAVIDSLTMLMHGIKEPDIIRRHVYQLTTLLSNAGCTGFIVTDPPAGSGRISSFGVEESIADGIILLRTVKEKRARTRLIEIYKLRGVNHASGDHTMTITSEGVHVYPRAEEVLR
ncbi:MAG: hypothetical protein EPO21_09430 [Chloroflexota bacterium]|nr:MAG: hypothetical protein EPO21_09430 [Chloroflexota bacterium]